MIYYITYFLTKILSFIYFPRRIYGREHLPANGGFIIASNHISNLDPVVMGISAFHRINFMAKYELFQKQPLGFFLRELGAFPIKRGTGDFGAFKESIKRLKKGTPILVFVEGTRRIGDTPSHAQPGIGLLAVKSGVPVIPVYINGTEKAMPPGAKFFTRHLVSVRYGPPVKFDPQAPYTTIADAILQDINRIASL